MKGWMGRVDAADGEAGLRWHQVVTEPPCAGAGIGFVGFACDEGVARNQGRTGAAAGPTVLRGALGNLALHHRMPMVDYGTLECVGRDLEAAQAKYSLAVAAACAGEALAIGLGGGHEIAWGSFVGLAHARPTDRIGVLNLDAHFDMRRSDLANSGTNFLMIAEWAKANERDVSMRMMGIAEPANTRALFATAAEHGVVVHGDEEVNRALPGELEAELETWIEGLDSLYLSICLDVFPAAIAPGVSAPAAYGVALDRVLPLLRVVARSGKLRIADVAELRPEGDIDGRTARTAARLIYTIVQGYAECHGML